MKVTKQQLLDAGACSSVVLYFDDIKRKQWDVKKLLKHVIKQGNYSDAVYGLSYLMTHEQRIEWSIYCAYECLHEFEKEYPDDSRPRKAIEAAQKYLDNPCSETQELTWSARSAARSARSTAWAATGAAEWSAAWSAAKSAESTIESARSAWSTARSTGRTVELAAESAAYEKLLQKGLEILLGERL